MGSHRKTAKPISSQSLGDLNVTVGSVPKNDLAFLLNLIIHIFVWSKTEKGTDRGKEHETKRETARDLRHKTD